MPDYGNYDDGSGGGTLLPVGEHACKLREVRLTEGKAYQSEETVQQLKWTFESLQWKDNDGQPGIITSWTGISYGNDKAKLTHLLDSIFDRHLTKQEWRDLDFNGMPGAVSGFVMVLRHVKEGAGAVTVKFGGFRNPPNRKPPTPEQFASAKPVSVVQTPTPKQVHATPQPETPFADPGDHEFHDPFADNSPENKAAEARRNANGTGTNAPF